MSRRVVLTLVGLAILGTECVGASGITERDAIRSLAATRHGSQKCTHPPIPLVNFILNDSVKNVRLYSADGPTRTRCVFAVAGAEIFEIDDIPSFNRFLKLAGIPIRSPEHVAMVVRSYMELTRLGAVNEYGIVGSADRIPFLSADAEARRREAARRFALHEPTVVREGSVYVYEYFQWDRSTATLSLIHASAKLDGLISVKQTWLEQWIDEATLIM